MRFYCTDDTVDLEQYPYNPEHSGYNSVYKTE